jgi:hypothetical protein
MIRSTVFSRSIILLLANRDSHRRRIGRSLTSVKSNGGDMRRTISCARRKVRCFPPVA